MVNMKFVAVSPAVVYQSGSFSPHKLVNIPVPNGLNTIRVTGYSHADKILKYVCRAANPKYARIHDSDTPIEFQNRSGRSCLSEISLISWILPAESVVNFIPFLLSRLLEISSILYSLEGSRWKELLGVMVSQNSVLSP